MFDEKKLQFIRNLTTVGLAAIIGCAALNSADYAPATAATVESRLPAKLRALLPQLRDSQTPVYLPTWIPDFKYKSYSFAQTGDFDYSEEGYLVALNVKPGACSNADCLFSLSGGKGAAHKEEGASKIALARGRYGYYRSGGNCATLDWSIGKYCFHLAINRPQAELVRVANSMVLVRKL